MLQIIETAYGISLRFELHDSVGPASKERDQVSRKPRPGVQEKGIRKFSRTDTVKPARVRLQLLFQFSKHVGSIAEEPQVGLVEISLQNAIGTIQGALRPKVKNAIAAAAIMAGSRACFDEASPEGDNLEHLRIGFPPIGNTLHNFKVSRGKALPQVFHERAVRYFSFNQYLFGGMYDHKSLNNLLSSHFFEKSLLSLDHRAKP
jgi:hypothetical protein